MTEAANWKDSLPDDIKTSTLIAGIDTPEKFWKRILDNDAYRGQSIRIPTDDASDEVKAEFRTKLKAKIPSLLEVPAENDDAAYDLALGKLGKPEKVDGYTLPAIENFSFTEDQAGYLRDLAATSSMTNRQFKNLAKKFAENMQKQGSELQNVRAGDAELIKKEWGMTAEERYAQVVDFAKKTNAPEHLIKALEGKSARASELLWLHNLMGAGKERSTVAGQDGNTNQPAKLTPFEAEERLAEIQNNKAHPYWRGDKNAQKRYMELVAMASA